jgi:dipeptidyl aminopeptidase/acylaminoacyl peptidase
MRLLFSVPATFALLMLSILCFSQPKRDTLSIEQALSVYSISSPLFSPDGSKAVVVVNQTGLGEGLPASHIWLVDVADKSIRQFTSSQKSENSPRWSPDGKTLAFLSARNGESQIFLMDVGGGEALQLTHAKTAVTAFEWNRKAKQSHTLPRIPQPPPKRKKRKATMTKTW